MTLLVALSVALSLPAAPASDGPMQLEPVVAALQAGDAAAVGRHLDETVELVLPEGEDILPRDRAVERLKGFFSRHAVRSFARVHGGTSRGAGGTYVIGTLACDEGDYRVYVYARGEGDLRVQELRIEAE